MQPDQGPNRPPEERGEQHFVGGDASYRLLLDCAHDRALFLLDDTGHVASWNAGAEHLLGYTAAEITGTPLGRLFIPEDVQDGRPEKDLQAAAAAGRVSLDRCLLHKDGGRVRCRGTVTALRRAGEGPLAFGVMLRQGEVAPGIEPGGLRESLRPLLESSWDVVCLLDRDGVVRYANPSITRILGYAPAEFVGRHALEPMHPDDGPATAPLFARLTQSPRATFNHTFRYRHRDGSWRWIEGAGTNLLDDPAVGAVVASFRDVTEHKALEQALQQRAEQLAEADRRKDQFLAMLAHELRNPLAPIRNALHLLRMSEAREEGAEWAGQMIERQVQTLVRLVEDLLDVSRITCGKIHLRPERVDLPAVLTRAVELARPLIDANRHQLAVSFSAEPLILEADPTRLEQVFANLLNNAAKYTERGGAITLTAERQEGQARVSVRDTGFGIAADLLPRVFDLFAQGDNTRDRAQGGLGIGLTLVKRLVELHGGSVTAHSEGEGKGSEFIVCLPLSREAVEQKGDKDRVGSPSSSGAAGGWKVLVVDDSKDATDSLALLLRLWGHEVRVAHDGQSALKAARSYRPRLVLMDIGLPGLTGHEVARQLRDEFGKERMLLVALTGYGQEEDQERSRQAGFDQHWVKPVEPATLQALLASLNQAPP
jgi:two-component system CheB/CheR fusion protein